jgi:ubiquinone/menaquinone biosynthesis C-methylase UbiE
MTIPGVFFELYSAELPRQGPGDSECTRRAFGMLDSLPEQPRIVDFGCGSGAQTLDLARLCRGRITAVDFYQTFLDELERRVEAEGFGDRVSTLQGDMGQVSFKSDSVDLIWSEGAVYNIGLETALKTWKPFVKPGGYIVVSECSWLVPDPPQEIKAFWDGAYPGMKDEAGNLVAIRACGYEALGHFKLPSETWWRGYYDHLARRLTGFEQRHAGDPEAKEVAKEARDEMDMFRRFSDCYGYLFHVMKCP